MNDCVILKYKGKFAHFLKAEANASAPSYPFPSRTVLLGLAGAVLGLSKDAPQTLLKKSNFAVSGSAETTHWHTANLRKDPPAQIPISVKKNEKGSSQQQRNTIITQEWLFKPNYTVWVQLPDEYHESFERRIKNRAWHFSPSLGLSEMSADLVYLDSKKAVSLEPGVYGLSTVTIKSQIELDINDALENHAVIKSIKMPRLLTENREFSHESYCYEISGKPIYAKTANAFKVGDQNIMWL